MYIDGKLNEAGFIDHLTKNIEEGGPEIAKTNADLFAEKIDIMLKEAREIRIYRDNFGARVASSRQADRIAEVRDDLVRESHCSLLPEQVARLDELLKFRIRGFIQEEDMLRRFETKFEDDGLGLDPDTAREAARYLEKILGQWMYI